MVRSASKPVFSAVLVVAAIGCRGDTVSTTPPDPQSAAATDVAPVEAPDPVREAVDMVSACSELQNLVPVMTAWDLLCQHATASGAEIAAQRIEACRADYLARARAKHPPTGDEPVEEGRGSEAFEAGLRDGLAGAKYDLLAPLSLDSCAPSAVNPAS